MSGFREFVTQVLIVALLAISLIRAARGGMAGDRFRRQLATDPGRRSRFYRRFIVRSWCMAAAIPVIALVSSSLSAEDLGWTWPDGGGIDYVLAGYVLVMIGIGAARVRYRMLRGYAVPTRAGAAPIVPRTANERRVAVAVALTAGITEEAFYRGLIIGAGSRLFHAPFVLVVLVSVALFTAAHAYQGRRAMIGSGVLGVLLTALYAISGSLLLAVVVHVCQDLVALLLIPPSPAMPATSDASVPPISEAIHSGRTGLSVTPSPAPAPAVSVSAPRLRPATPPRLSRRVGNSPRWR